MFRTYELVAMKDGKAEFSVLADLTFKERVVECVKAVIFSLPLFTLALGEVRNCWSAIFTGQKKIFHIATSKEVHPHRWHLLQRINLLKEQILKDKNWGDLLKVCPEAFEFAPLSVKRDPNLAKAAISGNGAMICHLDTQLKNNPQFMQELIALNPGVIFFLDEKAKIYNSFPEEVKKQFYYDPATGIAPAEMRLIHQIVTTYGEAWKKSVEGSGERFLYCKSKLMQLPCAIQVFKDKIWVHTTREIGRGSAKRVKLIYEWESGKHFVKAAVLKHLRQMGTFWGGNRTEKEIPVYETLKGKRGIVPLVDSFSYPSKSAPANKKTVLVQERYRGVIEQFMDKKFTKNELQALSLDLLSAVKAFRDADLYDADFNERNILVKFDGAGKFEKAGIIDFEQVQKLSQARKSFFKPKEADFEMLTCITRWLKALYVKNEIQLPQGLKDAFYQSDSTIRAVLEADGTERVLQFGQNDPNEIEKKIPEHLPTDLDLLITNLQKGN
jgi:hypothetical protein